MSEPMAVRVLREKLASNDGSIAIQQETANAVLREIDRLSKIEQAAQDIDRAIGRWAGVTLSPEVARAYGGLSDALDGIA